VPLLVGVPAHSQQTCLLEEYLGRRENRRLSHFILFILRQNLQKYSYRVNEMQSFSFNNYSHAFHIVKSLVYYA
jgi:hypothetical protein